MIRPESSRRLALVWLAAFALVTVVALGGMVMRYDVAVLRWAAAQRTPELTAAARLLSAIGEWYCEVPLALVIAALFWLRRRGADAWRVVALGVSTEALYAIAKEAFHRPRPNVVPHLGKAGWYSYPSGHAMLALTIWGFCVWYLAELVPWRAARGLLRVIAIAVPAAIALSRIYLGVHYPSDVLGAFCLSASWLLFCRAPSFWPRAAAATVRPR